LLALATLAVGAGVWLGRWFAPLLAWLPGCPFKGLTGWACLTCGATRCALALGHGEWRAAFHWHPVMTLAALLLPVAAAWDVQRAWRGEPYPDLPDSRAARWSAWILLFGTWVLQASRGI